MSNVILMFFYAPEYEQKNKLSQDLVKTKFKFKFSE